MVVKKDTAVNIKDDRAKRRKLEIVEVDEMIKKVAEEPQVKFILPGIVENTLNFIVAPPKVGKTTFCENLGLSIAAGQSSFMNMPLSVDQNKKVLMISLEEFYKNRTNRNRKQIEHLDSLVGNTAWHSNFQVVGADSLQYISTKEEWDDLKNIIKKFSPKVVIIDSLSRLHPGKSIEESVVANEVAKNLREIIGETNTTVIVIHHTTKLPQNEPISLFNMAGSRILSQEADSVIGLNKTVSGSRYIKLVACRYASDDNETVQTFSINSSCWLIPEGEVYEASLLKESDQKTDRRVNNTNRDKVLNFFLDQTKGDVSVIVEASKLVEKFLDTKEMTKPTLYASLDKLIEEQAIQKHSKGMYTLVQQAKQP